MLRIPILGQLVVVNRIPSWARSFLIVLKTPVDLISSREIEDRSECSICLKPAHQTSCHIGFGMAPSLVNIKAQQMTVTRPPSLDRETDMNEYSGQPFSATQQAPYRPGSFDTTIMSQSFGMAVISQQKTQANCGCHWQLGAQFTQASGLQSTLLGVLSPKSCTPALSF